MSEVPNTTPEDQSDVTAFDPSTAINALSLANGINTNVSLKNAYPHLYKQLEKKTFEELKQCFNQLFSAEEVTDAQNLAKNIILETKSKLSRFIITKDIYSTVESANRKIGLAGVGAIFFKEQIASLLQNPAFAEAIQSHGSKAVFFFVVTTFLLGDHSIPEVKKLSNLSSAESIDLIQKMLNYYEERTSVFYEHQLTSYEAQLQKITLDLHSSTQSGVAKQIVSQLEKYTSLETDRSQNNQKEYKEYLKELAKAKAKEQTEEYRLILARLAYNLLQNIGEDLIPLAQTVIGKKPDRFMQSSIAVTEIELEAKGIKDALADKFALLETQNTKSAEDKKPTKKKGMKKKKYKQS